MNATATRPFIPVLLGLVLLGHACGSDDTAPGTAAATEEVCGLRCQGSVACSNGTAGAASVRDGSCVLQGSSGTMTLTCDGKVVAVDANDRPATGAWTPTGSRQIDISLESVRYASCHLDTAGATSSSSARYAGVGDPCRFTTECSGYQGTGSPLACNTDSRTCCIQPGWKLECGSAGDCCGEAACQQGLCCQLRGAWCTQGTDCCSGSCNEWNWNCD